MKKIILVSFLILSLAFSGFSQSCLPGGLTIASENVIYGFRANFPDCTVIEGDVEIHGSNISDLSSLYVLTAIGGDLRIYLSNTITSLHGLHNVDSIGGRLEIHSVQNLLDLSDLSSLSYVREIAIASNLSLISLSGLENITSVENVFIFANSDLESLGGLNNLESVTDLFQIYDNSGLQNITGLDKLTYIGGKFILWSNINLEDISGLGSLQNIDGKIIIRNNYKLMSLAGLDNLDASAIDSLFIYENPLLTNCAIESMCQYLESAEMYAEIYDNAIGCNNPEEVQDSCEAHAGYDDISQSYSNILIYPNPASQELYISAEGLTINELSIYTLTGQQILAIRPKSESIDISTLQPSMYVVEVMVEGKKIRQKLVVE